MTNDNEPSPPNPDSSPAPNSSNTLATTNNILATVIQSVSKTNKENKDLAEKYESLSRKFDNLESLLSEKVAPNIGQLNDFFVKHKDSIESIPFIEQEVNRSVVELDRIIAENEKLASELLITTDEVKSIKISNDGSAPSRDLEMKLSAELEKAKLLNAKSTFESNSSKLILYGIPHGRSASDDIRGIFGEEIKRLCVNSAEVTRLRARGQAGNNDKIPPMLLEFFNTRSMRECRNLMRETLRDYRDKRFVKSIRIEEFLPSDLLPRKNFLHKVANAYKMKFRDIKLFRVSLSRKHFDLRVYIRLNQDAERDNKAAGRTLIWAEIDEKTLSDLTPFHPDIFREKSFAEVVRATTTVPQPMGFPQAPTPNVSPNDDSGALDNRMDNLLRNFNSPQGSPQKHQQNPSTPVVNDALGHTDDQPPLPPSPANPPGFPPLGPPKAPASELFRSPTDDNSGLVSPPVSTIPSAEEDEAVKRSSKKKPTKGVSTRSVGRGVSTIEEEDPANYTRLTNRQRKKSGRKEIRELKAENARNRMAAVRPVLSSDDEL